jgi:putative membrane protein
MMWGYPWSGAMMVWMSIWGLIWLVLVGLAIWALVQWVGNRTTTSSLMRGPSALEILRQRYARGEIDAMTFEQMRERLEATSARDESPAAPA